MSSSSSSSLLTSSSESSDYENDEFEKRDLIIIPRKSWGAPKPKWGLGPPLKTPAKKVFCTLTDRWPCFTVTACKIELMQLDKRDRKHDKYPDIRYSFVLGTNQKVFEGRGWITQPGLPKGFETEGKNSVYIGIAGIYDRGKVPRELIYMRDQLILHGIANNFIDAQYTLFSTLDRAKPRAKYVK